MIGFLLFYCTVAAIITASFLRLPRAKRDDSRPSAIMVCFMFGALWPLTLATALYCMSQRGRS